MRKRCPKCHSRQVIKHGKRRRKCRECQSSFRVNKRGSKTQKISIIYLLDRSTLRRIATKLKRTQQEIMRGLKNPAKAELSLNGIHYYLER